MEYISKEKFEEAIEYIRDEYDKLNVKSHCDCGEKFSGCDILLCGDEDDKIFDLYIYTCDKCGKNQKYRTGNIRKNIENLEQLFNGDKKEKK